VTERKQAEEALRAADQRKNEFFATLAHELRNPLSPIRNAAAILRAVREDAASHDKAVAMIDRQVTHMARLLDDLLDVARITNNKLQLKLQPVQVREAVDHAVEAVQPIVSTRRHRMNVIGPPKPLTVLADPVRLTQIFVNLLTNAAKYTPDEGSITVAISQNEGQAVIEVRDNGIGIAAEQIQNLFQLFSRVYTEPDIREGGLGVGLSLVKLLVEAQRGTVEATSSGIGQGSVFTVRLPLTEQAQESKTQSATGLGRSITPRRRVLVVDDNMDAAESMATLLRLKGHDVHVAYDGIRAVELAAAVGPNVVLLDLGLPGLNGAEVGRLIRTAMKDKPPRLVAVTGWGDVGDRQRTADAGFDLHLTKPIDPNALDALL
jgi:CheY-like chemotaxis protein